MNRLAQVIADIIRDRISQAVGARGGALAESRFIFNGPPLEIMDDVFSSLSVDGGISIAGQEDGSRLPVLLQVSGDSIVSNPPIGSSGRCDETHLLDLRNVPSSPSYLALISPGQRTNRSVSSTTDEFGLDAKITSANTPFEVWWDDPFIQVLVDRALDQTGITGAQREEARRLIERSAMAFDEVDADKTSRRALWSFLSRVHFASLGSIADLPSLISLACGVPPTASGKIEATRQLAGLTQLAEELADGFRTGVEAAKTNTDVENEKAALDSLLQHLQQVCRVVTAFQRAPGAYFAPSVGLSLDEPPAWWKLLTVERLDDLLSQGETLRSEVNLKCRNSLIPERRGMPALVLSSVELEVDAPNDLVAGMLVRSAGSAAKTAIAGNLKNGDQVVDDQPATHKVPLRYTAQAPGFRDSTLRVIALSTWQPGFFVYSRFAKKISPPKKVTTRAKGGPSFETSLIVVGSGRVELSMFVNPKVIFGEFAEGMRDDDDGTETKDALAITPIRSGELHLEAEVDGKYQIDVPLRREADAEAAEYIRIYITSEEISEVGCPSEFDRLIRHNRRNLESFQERTIIQIDRNSRLTSLQAWLIDPQFVERSYLPVVLAEDYLADWRPPDWHGHKLPRITSADFLHDPRPPASAFTPPAAFVQARVEIAARIRGSDEQLGVLETAPLGRWMAQDDTFAQLVERYLDAYLSWVASEPDVATWIDLFAVTALEGSGRTLSRQIDAVILTPMHPLRLSWHALAQRTLFLSGSSDAPCPAAGILDPDSIPDLISLSIHSPDGSELADFVAVECDSDYWSVMWNASKLGQLAERARKAPFDGTLGIMVGGVAAGFSAGQVARAAADVSGLLSAKSTLGIALSSSGGPSDSCTVGLKEWAEAQFGPERAASSMPSVGQRALNVYDARDVGARPDDATIANLADYTSNAVKWFEKQPADAVPDLGIIAQLETSEPELARNSSRSPLAAGALIRHRVRRQLPGGDRSFLLESRQGKPMPASGDAFADKVLSAVLAIESRRDLRTALRFAPNVHAIENMLIDRRADFVAVSSASVDPACFLGKWLKGAYLWDYDLPSYSQRAGDTNGYYLLSKVRPSDNAALRKVLGRLPGGDGTSEDQVEQILLEVARRGIPTLRGLSGDNAGATGDLGVFVASRLLQDRFRLDRTIDSLLPVHEADESGTRVTILVPVDPFRGFLGDLAVSLRRERKEGSLSRPDLVAIGVCVVDSTVRIRVTPIEVKCRQGTIFPPADMTDALGQARAFSSLLALMKDRAADLLAWRVTYQHLLLSMVSFGLRVYSQQDQLAELSTQWSDLHERIAETILSDDQSVVVDEVGRLIVIDDSIRSDARDADGDGFEETIVISATDASAIALGDPTAFYSSVRERIGQWNIVPHMQPNKMPSSDAPGAAVPSSDRIERSTKVLELDIAVDGVAPNPPATMSGVAPASLQKDEQPSDGIKISVGSVVDGFSSTSIGLNISDTRLNQLNIGVVGDLGTGKTQLLKSLIYQLSAAKEANRGIRPRMLILDYKRDYRSDEFVHATQARVVVPHRLPLNLFDTTGMAPSPPPWLERFRFFADVLDKIYSGIGPVQRDKLKLAVRSAYQRPIDGRSPTIYDVHAAYREILQGKSDSPMAIIDDLVDMEIFEPDPSKTIPFSEFLDGTVVVALDALGQDDRSKNMLVAILLNMFYEHMLTIPKRAFIGTAPSLRAVDSYLLVDEADNIMRYEFDVLRKLLLQGREFGVGVILASQYLRHFKVNATDYREPLLTWFVHKVPNVTAVELAALGLVEDLPSIAERIKGLPVHQCLYKTFDGPGMIVRGTPFFELLSEGRRD
ncbi:MAG: ATP-binding protein [Devosia sp.]